MGYETCIFITVITTELSTVPHFIQFKPVYILHFQTSCTEDVF
jgi:hypothetical protein